MIYIAFHFRLPTDKYPNLQGCWRQFTKPTDAATWLATRKGKTPTSPKGFDIAAFKSYRDVPADIDMWPKIDIQPTSYRKAVQSYINYANKKKEHARK